MTTHRGNVTDHLLVRHVQALLMHHDVDGLDNVVEVVHRLTHALHEPQMRTNNYVSIQASTAIQ
jgi:hypothetical protein